MKSLGMWVWPQNVHVRGAEQVVQSCAGAGVTDLYFLTKGLAGTISFLGSDAPTASERDLLRELLDAAHKRNMRVHAWFTSASDEHYKQLHPESGRYHLVRGRDRGLISLADEGYQRYMQRIISDLCRRYEVDGLHLDYIRYNHLLYGWAEEDLQRYIAYGANVKELFSLMEQTFLAESRDENCIFDAYRCGNEAALALARARRKDVVCFAEILTQTARAENSRLTLSAALMPEGAYEDTAFSDLHYGQNYEDAARLFDAALPMAYSLAYGKDEHWVKTVAEGTMKRGLRTIVGLHAYEGANGLTLKRDVQAAQSTAAEGICLFREGATALAQTEGKKLILDNTLDEDITAVISAHGDETAEVKKQVASGERTDILLSFEADAIRVFCGEKEACVFLSNK